MITADTLQPITGILHLQAIDNHGTELWRMSDHNLIVTGGYKAVAEALAGIQGASIASVAIGTNGTAPASSDTGITDAAIVEVQSVEFPTPATVRFNFTIGYNDANGMAIREFGLITADERLFSRKVREAIEKTEAMTIVGQWDIKF